MKKSLSIVLVLALFVSSLFIEPETVFAMDFHDNIKSVIDEKGEIEESIIIEDNIFVYTTGYYDGNRYIKIRNVTTNHEDYILCEQNTILLNGEAIGWIGQFGQINGLTNSGWITIESGSEYITTGNAASAAVLAGVIAIALGSLATPGMVIAAMSIGTLSILASMSSGMTITYTLSMMSTTIAINYRYNWSVRTSLNELYGPYQSIIAV